MYLPPPREIAANALSLEYGGYIVLPKNADARLNSGAQTLAKYLNQITGKNFPISADGYGLKFVLEYTDEISNNAYIIETRENEVCIKGSGVRGIIHGIYAFLEKYCDCNWYTSSIYEIPLNPNLKFPKWETVQYEPYFEYTETDWISPKDVEYSLANGLTGGVYRDIPDELGGAVEYIGNFAHTLAVDYCSPTDYFEEHPEYFALNDGVRQPTQLCLTNENVYKIVRDEVFEQLKQHHNPNASLQIISLTQADNQTMCLCDGCAALNAKHDGNKLIKNNDGDYYETNGSGTLISFVNRIARDVKIAGFDNVAIDTFAYRYTRAAPVNLVAEDNVIVRLCTIECCFAHTLDDSTCPSNAAFFEDLIEWSKICNRLYIWDYTTNYVHSIGIFPNFGVIQKNLQIFYENGVKGVYEEGNYYMSRCDTEFGELRAYLISKLLQNPYLDYDKAMKDFNAAFYGEASAYLNEFIKMTIEKPTPMGGHLSIRAPMVDTLGFNDADIRKANELWEAAKNCVKDDETLLSRVKRSELCYRYWKCCATSPPKSEEVKTLVNDLESFGVTSYREIRGENMDDVPSIIYTWAYLSIFKKIYCVFFAVALLITLVIAILTIKKKQWIYCVSLAVCLSYVGIFIWNLQTFLTSSHVIQWAISFTLIHLLLGFLGTIATRGSGKKRILNAFICVAVSIFCYLSGTVVFNSLIFGNSVKTIGIGISYTLLSIAATVIQSISLKNVVKEIKRQ